MTPHPIDPTPVGNPVDPTPKGEPVNPIPTHDPTPKSSPVDPMPQRQPNTQKQSNTQKQGVKLAQHPAEDHIIVHCWTIGQMNHFAEVIGGVIFHSTVGDMAKKQGIVAMLTQGNE